MKLKKGDIVCIKDTTTRGEILRVFGNSVIKIRYLSHEQPLVVGQIGLWCITPDIHKEYTLKTWFQ